MSLTPAPADEAPSTVRRPLKVLVVDDNVDAAEALADVITLWGHDAQTAFDGASGLAALNASTFDVVIVDITLPDFDGYELARRFRAAAPSTTMLGSARWIAVSGHDDDGEQRGAVGFTTHLRKPVAPEHLEAVLLTA